MATGTLGSYEIPSQSDIDGYTDDIPQSVLSKVIRDTNGDGIWDTGVMVFGITSTVDPAIAIDDVQVAIDVAGSSAFQTSAPTAAILSARKHAIRKLLSVAIMAGSSAWTANSSSCPSSRM